MITGSVASIIYGDPRLMHDIDIVLDLDPSRVHNFVAAFPAEEYYVAPIEIIKDELLRTERGHFKLIHLESGFKADIYLKGKSDLHEWALERSKKVRIKGIALSVAPPEYVILRKLEYFREGHSDRHLNDIKTIVKNSAKLLDTPFIENYCSEHGLSDLWKSVWRPGRVRVKVKESKRKEKRKKK